MDSSWRRRNGSLTLVNNGSQSESDTNPINSAKRKLYCESHGYFLCSEDPSLKSALYLSILEAYARNLELNTPEYASALSAKKIWHFCHLFYVKDATSWEFLRDWYYENFPIKTRGDWPHVYRLVLMGKWEEADEVMTQMEGGKMSAPKSIVSNMLLSAKRVREENIFDSESFPESWQDECSEQAETMQRDCGQCDEYANVLYILSCRDGDELQTLIHRLLPGRLNDSIFHQLFAELLYCDPHMTVRDFRETLRADADANDKVIQAFLCDDIELGIELSEKVGGSWLSAHLSHLLIELGVLDIRDYENEDEEEENISERYLLSYAQELTTHPPLWQLVIDYLGAIHQIFRSRGAVRLLRKCIRDVTQSSLTERKAFKLLHLCNKFSLVEEANGICDKLGQQKLSEKQIGAALHWYGLSKNKWQVSRALKRIQEEYIHQEAPEDLEFVIDNLEAGVFASNYFSFLAKLSKVQQEIKTGSSYSSLEDRQSHFEGAAKLIVDMISNRYAPRDFWFLLLKKIETFILKERVILSKETSQILLAALEELEVPKWATDPYANEPTYEEDEGDLGGEEMMETEEDASQAITTVSPPSMEVQQLRELLVRSLCTAIAY